MGKQHTGELLPTGPDDCCCCWFVLVVGTVQCSRVPLFWCMLTYRSFFTVCVDNVWINVGREHGLEAVDLQGSRMWPLGFRDYVSA